MSKPLDPLVELACQYLQSVDVNGSSNFINKDSMKRDIISEAKALLAELSEDITKVGHVVYHASPKAISSLTHKPLWFAMEKDHAIDGWFQNTLENNDSAFLYSATLDKPVSHIYDDNIVSLFDKIGVDSNDWVEMIIGNPSAEEVLNDAGTKALIAAGHIGLVYSDYDPRDFQKDLDALVVFDAAKHVKNWKLIKQIYIPG
jgi:hypothetical protein